MTASKSELLTTLRTRRTQWDALLATVGEERMAQPGAADDWLVKDVISHITAYERWLVEWLTAASQHTFPAPSPLDDADTERRNWRVFGLTHSMSLQEVLNDANQNFIKLLEAIQALPDEYFEDPKSAGWFMKPYWSKMSTVAEAVINLSTDHYEEHIPAMRAWIELNQPKEK